MKTSFCLAVGSVLLVESVLVVGRSAYALPAFGNQIPAQTNSCFTCHISTSAPQTWNDFGLQVRANLNGGSPDWAAVCDLDADGDGASNGAELGDPDCTWAFGDPGRTAVSNPADANSLPPGGGGDDAGVGGGDDSGSDAGASEDASEMPDAGTEDAGETSMDAGEASMDSGEGGGGGTSDAGIGTGGGGGGGGSGGGASASTSSDSDDGGCQAQAGSSSLWMALVAGLLFLTYRRRQQSA